MSKGTSHVEPSTLPATSAAAMYHSLRLYYHVMYWKGKGDGMKPEQWWWHIVDGKCLPMQTDKPAAPAELLDIIYCSCKKMCNTNRCTCRQPGLICVQNAEVQVVATRNCLMFPMIAWTEGAHVDNKACNAVMCVQNAVV